MPFDNAIRDVFYRDGMDEVSCGGDVADGSVIGEEVGLPGKNLAFECGATANATVKRMSSPGMKLYEQKLWSMMIGSVGYRIRKLFTRRTIRMSSGMYSLHR